MYGRRPPQTAAASRCSCPGSGVPVWPRISNGCTSASRWFPGAARQPQNPRRPADQTRLQMGGWGVAVGGLTAVARAANCMLVCVSFCSLSFLACVCRGVGWGWGMGGYTCAIVCRRLTAAEHTEFQAPGLKKEHAQSHKSMHSLPREPESSSLCGEYIYIKTVLIIKKTLMATQSMLCMQPHHHHPLTPEPITPQEQEIIARADFEGLYVWQR
jgi:hypothetical protein